MKQARGLSFSLLAAVALGGLSSNTALAQNVVALTGARLIDGTGAPAVEQGTIVIRDGRIAAIGASDDVDIPGGAQRVNLSGKTLVPGLINAHGHLNYGNQDLPRRERLLSQLRLYADYGVTAVVVLGAGQGDLDEIVRIRQSQAQPGLDRARVYVAGSSIQREHDPINARARVNAYADAGADIIKIHINGNDDDTPPAVYRELIDQAHQRGRPVAAHLYYLADAHGLLDANVDIVAHSVRDQDVDALLITKMKAQNVGYIPTLTRDLARFVYESTPDFFEDPFMLRNEDFYGAAMEELLDPGLQREYRTSEVRQGDKIALAQAQRNLKTLADAGVRIAMGTDTGTNPGQWQGYFEHVEMEMMVESGMTPAQVIRAATGDAALTVGLQNVTGTLRPGLWADLVVLDANPLENIRALREIDSVWVGGAPISRPD